FGSCSATNPPHATATRVRPAALLAHSRRPGNDGHFQIRKDGSYAGGLRSREHFRRNLLQRSRAERLCSDGSRIIRAYPNGQYPPLSVWSRFERFRIVLATVRATA